MKILLHVGTLPYHKQVVGGAETSLRLIGEHLAKLGHTVFLVGKLKRNSIKAHSVSKINEVNVVSLKKYYNPFRIHYINYLANKNHGKAIRRILHDESIDIVYTYYNLSLCKRYLSLKNSSKYQFKFIVRIAGMRWYEQIIGNASLQTTYAKVFEQADALNFISSGLYILFNEALQELKMAPDIKKFFIQDIGLDLTNKAVLKNKMNTKHFKCIMVSRFTKYQKRQDVIIRALALIDKKVPIQFTFVGDGPTKNDMINLTKQLGVENCIQFVPFLEQNKLWSLISEQDLLCHACDYEGLSKIILETMGLGIPVLVSDVLPLNDYIQDQKNGYLSKNTPESWAAAITKLWNSKNDLISVGASGASFAHKNYDATKNCKIYEEEFMKLLKN